MVFIIIIGGIIIKIIMTPDGMLSGIKFNLLESKRQIYIPSDQKCDCHTKNNNNKKNEFWTNPRRCEHRSQVLIMSFAGAALQIGGHTFSEFKHTLNSIHWYQDPDQLSLCDPSQSYYLKAADGEWNNIERLRSLRDISFLFISYLL